MKLSKVAYAILSTIFMLSMTAIFVAGSLIFLIAQLYDYMFEISGFWVTLPLVIATIVGLFFLFMTLIKNHFFEFFKPRDSNEEEKEPNSFSFVKNIFISIAVYEISRLIRRLYSQKKQK